MAEIAMSRTTFMLLFHIVGLIFLLSICGLFGLAGLMALGVPVVEMWQALMRWLRAAPANLKQAIIELPAKLLSLAVTGGIALGVIDAVKLERWRIDHERRAAIRDIHALAHQAKRHLDDVLAGTLTQTNRGGSHD
ncbi:MAG: hypothetical protein ACTHM1_12035 [Solirubrobacteraceae bacterium]